MTKEEWDARQSVIRKVVDPETGRTRCGTWLSQLARPSVQWGELAPDVLGWGKMGHL